MNDKILETICKLLGISSEYTAFNVDILVNINSALSVLAQLGVNSLNGFICTENSAWSEFMSDNTNLGMVEQYVYLKVKKVFDPPQSSFVMDSIDHQISELEWRINAAAESDTI